MFFCRYSDSNRDALALLPKSNVSTNFTIAASKYSIREPAIKQYLIFLLNPTAKIINIRGIAQFGSVSSWGDEGRGFEPHYSEEI